MQANKHRLLQVIPPTASSAISSDISSSFFLAMRIISTTTTTTAAATAAAAAIGPLIVGYSGWQLKGVSHEDEVRGSTLHKQMMIYEMW